MINLLDTELLAINPAADSGPARALDFEPLEAESFDRHLERATKEADASLLVVEAPPDTALIALPSAFPLAGEIPWLAPASWQGSVPIRRETQSADVAKSNPNSVQPLVDTSDVENIARYLLREAERIRLTAGIPSDEPPLAEPDPAPPVDRPTAGQPAESKRALLEVPTAPPAGPRQSLLPVVAANDIAEPTMTVNHIAEPTATANRIAGPTAIVTDIAEPTATANGIAGPTATVAGPGSSEVPPETPPTTEDATLELPIDEEVTESITGGDGTFGDHDAFGDDEAPTTDALESSEDPGWTPVMDEVHAVPAEAPPDGIDTEPLASPAPSKPASRAEAQHLVNEAIARIRAHQDNFSQRLNIDLSDVDGPLKLTIQPDGAGNHRVAFLVASQRLREELRRSLAEINEAVAHFPIDVSEVAIEPLPEEP